MKICKGCGKSLPLSQYYISRSCNDGLTTLCKSCFNARYSKNKSNKVAKSKVEPKKQSVSIAVVKPDQQLTNDLLSVLPENVPFTVRDVIRALNLAYNDNNRSKIQSRLYTLISNQMVDKVGNLHTGSILYMKKSLEFRDAHFEVKKCLKCGNPLGGEDILNNPNTKLCNKCNKSLTFVTKPSTDVTAINGDIERLATSMHNEMVLIGEKMSELATSANHLRSIEGCLETIQAQNRILLKILGTNCRTLPNGVTIEDL